MTETCSTDTGGSSPTVFIVDDDAAMRDALEVLLKSTGLRTQSFASADEFLRVYADHQPGCLILDVRMPDMDGLELQSKLVFNKAGIPVVFLTGYGEVPTTAQAFKLGAVDFLEKPVQENALLDAIRRALEVDRLNRAATGEAEGIPETARYSDAARTRGPGPHCCRYDHQTNRG